MEKNLTPRYLVIGLILTWAVYTLLPTWQYQKMTENQKEDLRASGKLERIETKIIKQGLDLKGGMYIVLEADIPTLLTNLATLDDERLKVIINKAEEESKNPDVDFFVALENNVKSDGIKLSRYYHEYGSSLDEILLSLKDEADDAINRVLEILQNRVDQFGVSEPTIQKQGKHRIVVELAGIQDSDRARSLLQSTALLEFYLVKNISVTNEMIAQLDNLLKGDKDLTKLELPNKPEEKKSDDEATSVSELFGESETTNTSTADNNEDDSQLSLNAPFSSLLTALPGDIGLEDKNLYRFKKLLSLPEVATRLKNSNGQFLLSQNSQGMTDNSIEKIYKLYYVEDKPELTGGIVDEARADLGSLGSGSAGQAVVSLSMNSDGSRTWSRVTGANIGERIAIVLDKKVHMAPSIREKIPSGRTQIEGFANISEAKDLAIILRAGALPAPVNIIEERIVGPSLGADSIKQGTQAVTLGLILVLIFILIYYKFSGLIASFALIWNILIVLAVLASLQATLTLPGIAGLILTVGMSIDANVIIFERIREEMRRGKKVLASIDVGYSRAVGTIFDANVTTLIAALILFQFGSGPVKGFAVTLAAGIITSVFTAVSLSRLIIVTWARKKRPATLKL